MGVEHSDLPAMLSSSAHPSSSDGPGGGFFSPPSVQALSTASNGYSLRSHLSSELVTTSCYNY